MQSRADWLTVMHARESHAHAQNNKLLQNIFNTQSNTVTIHIFSLLAMSFNYYGFSKDRNMNFNYWLYIMKSAVTLFCSRPCAVATWHSLCDSSACTYPVFPFVFSHRFLQSLLWCEHYENRVLVISEQHQFPRCRIQL